MNSSSKSLSDQNGMRDMATGLFFPDGLKEPRSEKVSLSKTLSWILRHGARDQGIQVHKDGYVFLDDILKNEQFIYKEFTAEDIQTLVHKQKSKRFTLRTDPETQKLQIRADRLHSFKVDDLGLPPVTDSTEYPTLIQKTVLSNWEKIKKFGLSMKDLETKETKVRTHFVTKEPDDEQGLSSTEVPIWIYLDLSKALKDGLKFFLMDDVVVTSGNKQGYVESKYFSKALNLRTGRTFGQQKK